MSFAKGFFGSLYNDAQARDDAIAEEKRMRMLKNLDLEYQRNKRLVKKDGKFVEIFTDGNGKEIPALMRELTPEEARKIEAEDLANQFTVKDTGDKLLNYDSEKQRKRSLEDEELGMKRERHKASLDTARENILQSRSSRSYTDALRGQVGKNPNSLDPSKLPEEEFNALATQQLMSDMSPDIKEALKVAREAGQVLTTADIEQAATAAIANAKDSRDAKRRLSMYLKSLMFTE